MDPGQTAAGAGAALVALVALVGVVVRWLVARATDEDRRNRERLEQLDRERGAHLEQLEGRVARLEADLQAAQNARDQAVTESAAYLGSLRVIRKLFGTLDPAAFGLALPQLLSQIPDQEGIPR